MLKRKIYDDLVAWKQRSGGTTALLIDVQASLKANKTVSYRYNPGI